jgi:hypothetical protein
MRECIEHAQERALSISEARSRFAPSRKVIGQPVLLGADLVAKTNATRGRRPRNAHAMLLTLGKSGAPAFKIESGQTQRGSCRIAHMLELRNMSTIISGFSCK